MISKEQKQRLIDELSQLDDRSEKLLDFIDKNPAYGDLDSEMQFLLNSQYHTMRHYAHILERRMTLMGVILE